MVGLGAVLAALLFSGPTHPRALRRRLIIYIFCWGIGLIVLGTSKNFWTSISASFAIGYFMMTVYPTINSAIQNAVDDSMRGRVMSLYTMTFLGSMPLGGLVIGWSSDRYSAPFAITCSGALTILIAAGFAMCAPVDVTTESASDSGREMIC